MKRQIGKQGYLIIVIFSFFLLEQSVQGMTKIKEATKDYISSAKSLASSATQRISPSRESSSSRGSRDNSGREINISGPTNVARKGQEESLKEMRAVAEKKGDTEAMKQIDSMLQKASAQNSAREQQTGASSSAREQQQSQSVSPSDRQSLSQKTPKSNADQFNALRGSKKEQELDSLSNSDKTTKKNISTSSDDDKAAKAYGSLLRQRDDRIIASMEKTTQPQSVSPSDRQSLSQKTPKSNADQFNALRGSKKEQELDSLSNSDKTTKKNISTSSDVKTSQGESSEAIQKGATALNAYLQRKAVETKIANQEKTPDQTREGQKQSRIKEAQSQGMSKESLMHNLRVDHQALPVNERANEIKATLDPKGYISRALFPNSADRDKETVRRQENIKVVEAASEKMQKSITDMATHKANIQDLQEKIAQSPTDASLSKQLEKAQKRLNSAEKEHKESSAVMDAAYEKSAAVSAQMRVVQSGLKDETSIKNEQLRIEKSNAILDEAFKKYNRPQ